MNDIELNLNQTDTAYLSQYLAVVPIDWVGGPA